MSSLNRRQWLSGSGAVVVGAVFGGGRRAWAAPRAVIKETKVISQQPELYHGWPTLARCQSGRLLLVCSGGREAHVCPFGRVELMDSNDEGRTWSRSQVLMDCPIDDRDAGVLETARRTILVTTFTSRAYESTLTKAEKIEPGQPGAWPEERLRQWQAAHHRLTAAQRQTELGVWMIRSTDGGKTWSDRYDCLVDSPHGPIQLSDGRLLYAGKDLWRTGRVGVSESTDDGQTWRWLGEVPEREGDSHRNYHELHAVETADGPIVVQIRNHNKNNAGETLQAESTDGGKHTGLCHKMRLAFAKTKEVATRFPLSWCARARPRIPRSDSAARASLAHPDVLRCATMCNSRPICRQSAINRLAIRSSSLAQWTDTFSRVFPSLALRAGAAFKGSSTRGRFP